MARQSIAEALEGLTENFIQIQKSYIVNFLKIDAVSTNHVVIGDNQLPIGAQFKTVLFKKLK